MCLSAPQHLLVLESVCPAWLPGADGWDRSLLYAVHEQSVDGAAARESGGDATPRKDTRQDR